MDPVLADGVGAVSLRTSHEVECAVSDLASMDLDHVLRDGTTVHVRAPVEGDEARVEAFWSRLSPDTIRYRFGGGGITPHAAWIARMLGRHDPEGQVTRVATTGRGADERIVGLAQLNRMDDPQALEFGALVEDAMQGRGIGTVLLRELAGIARSRGVDRLVGDVLADNVRMLQVLRDLGLSAEQRLDGPYLHTTFDLQPTQAYLASVARDEKEAARHAMERFLRPRSIAVVGASRSPTSIGGLVFRNIVDGEFAGPVFPVNPNATSVRSVAAFPSLGALPEVPDLVVVCVPAPLVADVVDEAGALGVKAVCVITAGFAETGGDGRAAQQDLVTRAHAHGLRLIGPNCMGVSNGAADVRMNATFSRVFPGPGRVSFLSQSGALGLSVLRRFGELGLGMGDFVSVGNKADVSGNDLLLYWEDDPHTDVIALYLESFGNPRRFARIARRIGRTKPIVAVKAGRTSSGQRAASSHTAALAAGDVAVDALFRQAGVIRAGSLDELLDVTSILATQPVPRGRRLGILTNGGGPGILAADAAEASGLIIPPLPDDVRDQLAAMLPLGAGTSNPVDLVASSTAEQYRQAVEVVAASGEVDALLVIFIPPILAREDDVAAALAEARAAVDPGIPIVGVFMGQTGERPELAGAGIPAFASAEQAAVAMGRVADHAAWRTRPEGSVVRPRDVDRDAAREVVAEVLAATPDGTWLSSDQLDRMLDAYGIPRVRTVVVDGPGGAADAQAELDGTVVVKLDAPVHKRDIGAVHTDVDSPQAAAAAVRAIDDALEAHGMSEHAGRYLVQEQVADGVEVVVGVTHDALFGPLVMVGLGGTMVELVRDVSVRITPLTDVDVDDMLGSLRTAPLLTGYRGSDPMDVAALRDVLFRISALVEDVPEVAELDLNPVFVRRQGVVAVDARLRLAPPAGPVTLP